MNLSNNVSLADFSTMHLGGTAAHCVTVSSHDELVEAINWAESQQLPVLMIGGGSNLIWRDSGFQGLLIINKIMGYATRQLDDSTVEISVGAGENWDSVVERSVAAGLSGIEALSLVPGSAGATPIQNVGAYGQEIANVLVSVAAFDSITKQFVTILATDCDFSYRKSRFNSGDKGRFYITEITLRLLQANPQPPYYSALASYFTEHAITEVTPAVMRAAVIDIRTTKLPDPAIIHNSGSFFGNPIVDQAKMDQLLAEYSNLPSWPMDGNRDDGSDNNSYKIPAAWLIEQAGFKDYHDIASGMGTWPKQPLILINEHARTTADLLAFKQKIVDAVVAKFGITLVQEPELLPDEQA